MCCPFLLKNVSGFFVYRSLFFTQSLVLMIFCAVFGNDTSLAKICFFKTPFQSDISARSDLLPVVAQAKKMSNI